MGGAVMETKMNLIESLHVKEDGLIFIDDDRSILITSSAFGTLRRDLIKNIGKERMKGFLIRYGWELGQKDAEKVLKKNQGSVEDKILYGPVLHRMTGQVLVEATKLDVKLVKGKTSVHSVHMEGTWKESYEAEEHLKQFGRSKTPVCFTVVGYASGYLSKICNQTVIFKEITCQAKDHAECKWVAKSLDYWNGEVDDELQFYKELPIVQELEMTFEKLLEEKNNLEKSTIIHEKLTEEILQGNNLESIASVVYDLTATPGIIVNTKHQPLAYTGLSPLELNKVNEEMKTYLKIKQKPINKQNGDMYPLIHKTEHIKLDNHSRLITPIILQEKIVGYCSFIYLDDQAIISNIHKMILERIASVSSLYLLNEKTKFGADRRMMEHLFDEILRDEFQNEEEILRRGSLVHLDLSESYTIVTVKYQYQEKNLKEELAFHEEVLEVTSNYFKDKEENILVGRRLNSIILLVPKKYTKLDGIKNYCEQYLRLLADHFRTVTFLVGISKESDKILEAKNYYNESLIALRMSTVNSRITLFDSLGIVGPLINQNNENEIKNIAGNILGALLADLDSKKIDLLKTLYVFLSKGGNLEQTAADICLSLSGLRYRLLRIEDLLGHDLRNPFTNHHMFLALQSLVLIGELELNDI